MGISQNVFDYMQHVGFFVNDGRQVRACQSTQLNVGGTVNYISVSYDFDPIISLPSQIYPDNLYDTNAFDYLICRPDKIVSGVTQIRASKSANSNTIYIKFCDDNNNVIHQTFFGKQWKTNRMSDPSDPLHNWLYACDTNRVGLVVYENAGEKHISFTVSNEIDYFYQIGIYAPLAPYNFEVGWQMDGFTDTYFTDIVGDNVYDPTGNAAPEGEAGGGHGDFMYNNENVTIPSLPAVSVCDTGFVSLYAMDTAQLQSLASDLWNPNFFNAIVKNFESPFDNIISLGIIPITVTGTLATVVIGNYTSSVSGNKVGSTFIELDFGNIDVIPYYDNFADYEIKIQLFLPYCGIIELSPADIMDKTINVKYHIDIFSGACVAFVTATGSIFSQVLYTKEGNCRVELPFSGRDYAQFYNGIQSAGIQMGIGAAGMAAGNPMAISGLVSGAVSAFSSKPATQRGGSVSGTAAYMNIQRPYVIYTIPNYFIADNMKELKGYVSNLKCTIGDESGFISATIDNADLTGFETATDEELEMIKTMLADGIYIS